MKSKKKPSKILKEMKEHVSNRKGLLKQTDETWDGDPIQKAEIRMRGHLELITKIEAMIKVCVFALDGNGTYSTWALFSQYTNANTEDRNTSICIVLETILTLLPKRDMLCYDEILEILSDLE